MSALPPVDPSESQLTEPQARLLAKVRQFGSRVFNARARRPIERLENLGLVSVDWDMDLVAMGGVRWRITVTAVDSPARPQGSGEDARPGSNEEDQ